MKQKYFTSKEKKERLKRRELEKKSFIGDPIEKIKKLVATINVTITATDCIINEVGLYGRMVASNFRGPQFDAHKFLCFRFKVQFHSVVSDGTGDI